VRCPKRPNGVGGSGRAHHQARGGEHAFSVRGLDRVVHRHIRTEIVRRDDERDGHRVENSANAPRARGRAACRFIDTIDKRCDVPPAIAEDPECLLPSAPPSHASNVDRL